MTDSVYLDSNIIIYHVEGHPEVKARVRKLLAAYLSEGRRFVTSEITLGECLLGAYKKAPHSVEAYNALFGNTAFISLSGLTSDIIRRAAILGTELNMKLIDAVHVATAEDLGCTVFLTNDRSIRAPADIEIRHLPDLA